MPKYKVTADLVSYVYIVVEAKDEDEAFDIASDAGKDGFIPEAFSKNSYLNINTPVLINA